MSASVDREVGVRSHWRLRDPIAVERTQSNAENEDFLKQTQVSPSLRPMEAVHAFHHLDPVRNTQLVAHVRHFRALHVRVIGSYVTAEVLLLGEHGVKRIYAAFVSCFVVTVRTSLERVVGLRLRRKMHIKAWDRLLIISSFLTLCKGASLPLM